MAKTGNTTAVSKSLPKVEPFLLDVADIVNTTLNLDTLLKHVAEIVHRIINYEIFAILLLNERTQDLHIRFAVGHEREVIEHTRIHVGEGVTGVAALTREAVLVGDISRERHYIEGVPGVHSELAVPLIARNRVIGVMDLEAPQKNFFTERHKQVLTLIASRIATAIQNARLYTRVARQAKSLSLMNEISRDLTSILNLDELLERVGEQVKRLIDYQMFSILLLNESGQKLVHRFSLRFDESVQLKHDIPLDKGLVGYAALHNEAVLVPDVRKDPRYINLNPETRSELCVPLVYKDKVIGVLDIEHTRRNYITETHLRTITTLAAQVAIAIENARLYETVTRHEQQMKRDLALARELQFRIMPSELPSLKNADVAARFVPAHLIGGDVYDFIPYSRDPKKSSRTGIAIGDVSGKGAPAAIYAALVSGFLRSHAVSEPGAAVMLEKINRSLTERPIEAQYISLIYALWDDQRRQLRVSNSGLPMPVYCHNGQLQLVEATGLPIGLFPTAEYDETTFHAHDDDVFVFFSDGIVDATDPHGKMFGRSGLERVVAASCSKPAQEIVDLIFEAVAAHDAGVEPFDDQTVVVIKVRKAATAKSAHHPRRKA